MEAAPQQVQVIGQVLALLWPDGTEHYLPAPYLRARSPSAEVAGERDVFGRRWGGEAPVGPAAHAGVHIVGWDRVGDYALRLEFSDGHRTGLYTYGYLRRLGAEAPPA